MLKGELGSECGDGGLIGSVLPNLLVTATAALTPRLLCTFGARLRLSELPRRQYNRQYETETDKRSCRITRLQQEGVPMQYLRDLMTVIWGLVGAGIVVVLALAITIFVVWIITLL